MYILNKDKVLCDISIEKLLHKQHILNARKKFGRVKKIRFTGINNYSKVETTLIAYLKHFA